MRLWKLRATFLTEVEIIGGHCCPFCDSHDGKKFSLDDAIANQYLDSKGCSNEYGCTCTYAEIAVRDSDGRLIML